jgi:hypothetical protein
MANDRICGVVMSSDAPAAHAADQNGQTAFLLLSLVTALLARFHAYQ